MNKFFKDLCSIGYSKILIIIFSLARAIIIARWLGPEKNGIITSLLVYPTLFMSFGSLGISQATTYYVGKNKYDINKIKSTIVQIWLMTSIVSTIICYLLIRYFSNNYENNILIFLSIFPVPFSLFITYNSGIFLGQNKIQDYNKINWLPTFFILVSTVFLLIIFPLDIYGALLSTSIGTIFMFIVLLFKNNFISLLTFKMEIKLIKELLKLGLIYAISLIIINLNYRVDVIIMDKLSNPFQLGIYSKGVNIIEYLWQIPMFLSTLIFSRSSISKDGNEFSKKVMQLMRISIIVVGFSSLILLILSNEIITLLFGDKFIKSASVLQILLPGVVLLTVFKIMNMDLAGKGKPWIAIKAMLPSLFINIILNIILVPKYGANGAALSSTLSYSSAAIIFLYFYAAETGQKIIDIIKFNKNDLNIVLLQIKYLKRK